MLMCVVILTWTTATRVMLMGARMGTRAVQRQETSATPSSSHLPPRQSARGPPASIVTTMP